MLINILVLISQILKMVQNKINYNNGKWPDQPESFIFTVDEYDICHNPQELISALYQLILIIIYGCYIRRRRYIIQQAIKQDEMAFGVAQKVQINQAKRIKKLMLMVRFFIALFVL